MAFKKFFKSILEVVVIAAIAIFAVTLIRKDVANPYAIAGTSMVPTFHDGDYVFVDELTYRFSKPQRGDVVVFHAPFTAGEDLIKRVIGLPGERVVVKNGQVTIFSQDHPDGFVLDETYLPRTDTTTGAADLTLGAGQYFVIGDNRPVSFDSRSWGPVDANEIVGLVRLRVWPPAATRVFAAPQY